MPRNSSGNYTLPAGNPVVPNTLIETTWANPTLSDVAASITDSLDRYGRGGMLAQLKLADGTVGAPAFAFNSEASTGLLRPSSGVLNVSVLASIVASFTAAGLSIPGTLTAATLNATTFNATTLSGTDLNLTGKLSVGGPMPAAVTNARSYFRADAAAGIAIAVFSETFGSGGIFQSRAIGGTPAAPTATPINTNLLALVGAGTYDGTNFNASASVQLLVEAVPTVSSQPSAISFQTTPVGSVTRREAMRLDSIARLTVNPSGAATFPSPGADINGMIRARGAIVGVSAGITTFDAGTIAGFPCFALTVAGASADNKAWVTYADTTNSLHFQTHNDAFSVGNSWLDVVRSGALAQSITFPAGILGIGALPLANVRLTVDSGTFGTIAVFNSAAASGGVIRFDRSGTPFGDIGAGSNITTGGISDLAIGARGVNNVLLATNSVERMRVDGSGNVAIGASPQGPYAFEVFRGSGPCVNVFRSGSNTGYSDLRFYNDLNNGNRAMEVAYSGSAYPGQLLGAGPTGEQGTLATTGAFPLSLGTNNTARILIDGAGTTTITALKTNRTWQNVTASRNFNTDYTAPAYEIMLCSINNTTANSQNLELFVNGASVVNDFNAGATNTCIRLVGVTIPAGATYRINATANIAKNSWTELR